MRAKTAVNDLYTHPESLELRAGTSLEPDGIEHWLKDLKGVPFIFKDNHHCLAFVGNRMTLERSVLVVHGALEGDCEVEKQLVDVKSGVRHQRVVYSGIKDMEGMGKGHLGLFVLS
ncbi:uncharacterized protein BT62DRAFT_1007770 [Guyanagaster necrorhizus]|uniref:Uncharacterized protein n=1 Tax=Guyanagaster necrorhizus TaxID=856835 RepID=A0A9P7VRR8_9AGAR|nr:uncharacterized protein BT62DRAFT_1007770 [Guyanagaster necrorhizus MCA 3950]KAG7444749.1 hypothetical protein BT62DRAFT_1007770 [Guyanagaster necrorhizus MCA 3950]